MAFLEKKKYQIFYLQLNNQQLAFFRNLDHQIFGNMKLS